MRLDAAGKACPIPVIMAKKELDNGTQDLSILVDESVKWHDVSEAVRHMVKKYEFIEEYRGKQIPEGKKSLVFRVWIGNDDSTMTSKQIDKKMAAVMKSLQKKCGAALREE